MEDKDIRWKQRFSNFEKAFSQFEKFIQKKDDLNELEKQGLIQSFEYTHELAWNVLKDYLQYEGIQNLFGSRSTVREAFNKGLVDEGQIWMDMIESRNKTVHIYEENILNTELDNIINKYHLEFSKLYHKFKNML